MAFSGKATYDNVALIGEDVSGLIALIGPTETPFLSLLSDPGAPGTSYYHQWTEELLGPDTIICSTAVNSATAATGITINGLGLQLQAGMLVQLESNTPGLNEVAQITSVPGANSILIARGKGAYTSSLAVGGTITILGTAALEGDDVATDVTRRPTRSANVMQIFKKDVIISGSDQAVTYQPPSIGGFNHQAAMRTAECLRDLEKTIIRGVIVNSLGTSAVTRTMAGLEARLTAINSTIVTSSFTADPVLYVNDLWQAAWNAGARDIDLILCGATWKRSISGTNASVLAVQQGDASIARSVESFRGDFGIARVLLSPWMPASAVMLVSTGRIRPVPLQGRSFAFQRTAKTGDSEKGMVVGEYTVEIHQPGAMAYGHI